MKTWPRLMSVGVLGLFLCLLVASEAIPLTVEKISLDRLSHESNLIVYGTVLSSRSQWEGRNINTYTTIRVQESLKGQGGSTITVKQMGGKVGDIAEEIPGSPQLLKGEDVVLFLTNWQGHYWIHSIVLGKFSVVEQNGTRVAYNDLNNVGLIDPVTKREVTDPTAKVNAFPLDSFLNKIRSTVSK